MATVDCVRTHIFSYLPCAYSTRNMCEVAIGYHGAMIHDLGRTAARLLAYVTYTAACVGAIIQEWYGSRPLTSWTAGCGSGRGAGVSVSYCGSYWLSASRLLMDCSAPMLAVLPRFLPSFAAAAAASRTGGEPCCRTWICSLTVQ